MKIAILCLLSATLVTAASIRPSDAVQSIQPLQPAEQLPHSIQKRFILDLFDDDDYFDDFPLRRRRPSRRTIQLAQMIRQLAGPQGLTPQQVQNMMGNLQSLQMMQNMQQMMQMQNVQAQPSTVRPLN